MAPDRGLDTSPFWASINMDRLLFSVESFDRMIKASLQLARRADAGSMAGGRRTAALLLAGLLVVGCGSPSPDNQTAQNGTTGNSTAPNAAAGSAPVANPASNTPSPTDIVSQFLDQIRRGGEDSGAGTLLTTQAQSELKRIGQTIQPIGSPDAAYQVTRAQMVPGDPNSALVHCIWTEPDADGSTQDFQVVWAVEREAAGWRISGLAMELEAGAEPMIIDFENGERMAQVLSAPGQGASSVGPAANGPATSQAKAPQSGNLR